MRRQEAATWCFVETNRLPKWWSQIIKNLDRGTLRAILRGAGIAVEEFSALLGWLPVTAFVIRAKPRLL
jgi:hypothetical protein